MNGKEKSSDWLKRLLQYTLTLYSVAHRVHFNYEGENFYSIHLLFGEIYKDLQDSVDDIGENIRKLGFYVYPENMMPASVEGSIPNFSVHLNLYKQVIVQCIAAATEDNNQGLLNYLAARQDQMDKWSWFIDSENKAI